MIQALSRRLAALAGALLVSLPLCARATFVADPAVLYQQMKDAYARDAASGWNFRGQATYLATIFNAGRAYSLQYPTDPNYGVLATLTVQIGSGLHYNPLTNHDGAVWWVREASDWSSKHASDVKTIEQAQALLLRVNSEDDPEALARYADEDATANLRSYPGDVDALLVQVEANWRGWLLTHDAAWRTPGYAPRRRRRTFRSRTFRRRGATSWLPRLRRPRRATTATPTPTSPTQRRC